MICKLEAVEIDLPSPTKKYTKYQNRGQLDFWRTHDGVDKIKTVQMMLMLTITH